ncbi:hypothetical protein B30_10100 [Celeribacter baekdonensis B30]|uniref:Type I restriction enzyme HindI endonuclease subunit-like C-terminal domain-containing protein n=1 Tax=Celeribacter baekdonensis B30 TaxID=1208323 RepID=K2J8G1_9RHOB|nr:hypothetical protein B30_10100 [Celeribacter baekdonensis B30]KAB6714356.1 DUF3387 domain-containing protein [Roseobacter sp. TSBP12]|tara:strand:- start:17567 stop:17782 length:216 start_codon:yes stop_codon:yes gene_type:complete
MCQIGSGEPRFPARFELRSRHFRLRPQTSSGLDDPVSIRRILKKHGFPPDLQAESVKKVLQQAEVLAKEFA